MTILGAVVPFASHCDIEDLGLVDGVSRLRIDIGPHHMNNIGIVHGGVICTLLDVAMGSAARVKAGAPVMTVDMHVIFLAAVRGVVTAEGRVIRAGRSILFAEAEARSESGETVARSTGVFKRAAGERGDHLPKT
jgi:uncharacterized protein (TIGR00369 family)